MKLANFDRNMLPYNNNNNNNNNNTYQVSWQYLKVYIKFFFKNLVLFYKIFVLISKFFVICSLVDYFKTLLVLLQYNK